MIEFLRAIAALALLLATILALYHAAKTARTPQGAMGWVVLILALPPVGVPAYALFGYANYAHFSRARRRSDARLPDDAVPPPEPDRLAVFQRLGWIRAENGNGCDLLIDGQATYDALIEAIEEAQHYLLLQFYTLRSDEAGRRFKEAVIARAQAGVRVRILHDAFRGVGLPHSHVRDLREAGVEVLAPKGPRRALGRLQINFRYHRKLLVADGSVGFTGGLNIGREYLGLNPRIGRWRDTFVRLRGPMVAQLQRSFVSDWLWATGEDISETLSWSPQADPRDMRGLILSPAPTDRLKTGNLYFGALAALAEERLWITSPYFVPDNEVLCALKLAALRGVEVRILIPDRPDQWLPWVAAFSYFDEARDAGIEIWRYTSGFLHQKVALVDDDLVSIGTINLDIRSGFLNFEQTAILQDKGAASAVEEMLKTDFANAYRLEQRLTDQPAHRRIAARIARLGAPLM